MPHHDGDELTFRLAGAGPLDGFYIQRVSVAGSGDITVTLTKDNLAIGHVSLRSDGTTLFVLREEMPGKGVALVYDTPLPYVSVPLRGGVTEVNTSLTVQRASSGETVATGKIEQRVAVTAAPTTPPALRFELRTERRISFGDQSTLGRSVTWLQPGIGAVVSESASDNGAITRQELVCAFIDGKQIGDCNAATAPPSTP